MRVGRSVALLGVSCIVGVAWAGNGAHLDSGNRRAITVGEARVLAAESSPFRFFAASSLWNRRRTPPAALAAHSSGMVRALEREVTAEIYTGGGPSINTVAYSVPVYTVEPGAATVAVALQSASPAAALRAAWRAVPLPANAHPAAGSDGHLVVWQPSSDELWEFWRLDHDTSGWHASWGGAMRDVSRSAGVYGPEAWPGATRSWGASASSLSIAGGLITLEDLEHRRIPHALAIGIPQVRAGVYATPARRTDGRSRSASALPEGARLQLDPHLNLAALHLPPLTRMLAEAAQRYGIIVRDRSSDVTFYAQDPTPTGANPYSGPHGYFEGQTTSQLLRSFPWAHLRVLRAVLHRASPSERSVKP